MRKYACLGIILVLSSGSFAADIKSGPDAGTKAPPLKVFAATGLHENKELDIAGDRKDKPTVYLFIPGDKWGRPTGRFLKTLDKELAGGKEKAEVVAVWLVDQIDQTKEHLPRVQQSLQMEATSLTVFTGEKPGPKNWNINDMAHLTAVICHRGSVVSSIAYQSLNETDVAGVIKALRKAVEAK